MSEVSSQVMEGELVTSPPARETKPGYKTTELYVALAVIVSLVLDIIPAPQSKEGLYSTIIGAAYVIARGLAKLGVPEQVGISSDLLGRLTSLGSTALKRG